MHAKEQLAEQLGEAYGYISELLDHKIEEVKLSAAERSAKTVSGVILALVLGILGGMALIFGLIGLAFWLASAGDTARGFAIVSLVLFVLLLVVFLARRLIIVNPTVTKVINLFFAEPNRPDDHE